MVPRVPPIKTASALSSVPETAEKNATEDSCQVISRRFAVRRVPARHARRHQLPFPPETSRSAAFLVRREQQGNGNLNRASEQQFACWPAYDPGAWHRARRRRVARTGSGGA